MRCSAEAKKSLNVFLDYQFLEMGRWKSEELAQITEDGKCGGDSLHGGSEGLDQIRLQYTDNVAVLSPLASSMFTPGIEQIAEDLKTFPSVVVGATTGFVVFLGLGPLILAPLSETFGRRKLYLICFSIFAILQIPTALSPSVESLIAVRALSGFFGSMCYIQFLIYDLLLTSSRCWYRQWRWNNQ